MNTVTLIKNKRRGQELSEAELRFLIEGYTKGDIPEYQLSAFLMAVYFKGLTSNETANLVHLMKNSGATVDLSRLPLPKVDKHSTGGIGDKTTFLLGPLLASCGLAYPTIAGRGLAHTGGTIDKLEAIPGFNCFLPLKRFEELVASTGLCFLGQTEEICPADRKLYALRDVTGTVESIPLIVASIMSKKLAEGIDAIVFDVKTGSGAFMKSERDAVTLARALVATAKAAGKLSSALVTDMSEPLGRAVGNAIEVNECVSYLRRSPEDKPADPRLHEVTMALAVEMYTLGALARGERRPAPAKVRAILEEALASGRAYAKFLEVISLQGGDTVATDEGLPLAPHRVAFTAQRRGFIRALDGEQIGMALVELGGGRKRTADRIDHGVGFWFHRGLGDPVKKGEVIAEVYARDAQSAAAAVAMLELAVEIGVARLRKPKLIRKRI